MISIQNRYNKYKLFINSFSLYLLANILQLSIGLIMNPIWASNLSHKDYAIIGYFDSFSLLILPLISFSLFSYYTKEYFHLNERERKNVLSTLLIFQLLFGFISMLILLGCFKIYFFKNNITFPFFPYAVITFFKIYVTNFFTFYTINLRLEKNAKRFFKINVINIILNTILVFIFVVILKKGAFGNMFAVLLSISAISIYSLFKQLNGLTFDKIVAKKALSFCWPLVLSAILTYFFTGFDKLLIEKLGDVRNFGLYNIGFKFASYFTIFTSTINSTFESDFYEAIANRNKYKLLKIFILLNTIITIPIIAFILSSNFVVGLLTNYRYVEASSFANILVLSNITQSISFTLSTIIVALGFSKISLLEKLIGTLFAISIYIYLTNNYGFWGAAWGNVISYMVMSLISIVILAYIYKTKKYYTQINIK